MKYVLTDSLVPTRYMKLMLNMTLFNRMIQRYLLFLLNYYKLHTIIWCKLMIYYWNIIDQWRHQDLKVGGQEGGNDWLWGGKHVRVAHIASAKREPIFFELLGSDFFWANMCAERT